MKTAIIYYSLEGNTDFIAKKIAAKTKGDLIELVPEKAYPTGKVSKFFWGGKSVVFGEKPKLKNAPIDIAGYDRIFIGTPIWAGKFAPPIKTFLDTYKISGKDVMIFACHGGGGADKCFNKMKNILKGNNVVGTYDFLDPFFHSSTEDWNSKIEEMLKK